MKKKISWLVLIPIIFFAKCNPLPNPAASALTTFTIPQPLQFECYKERQISGSPKTFISVVIYIKSYYFDGTSKVNLQEETITVNPNTNPFPISTSLLMPVDGKLGAVDITIEGLDCSDCANGFGDPAESTGACHSVYEPNTSPAEFRAAKPRWTSAQTIIAYASDITLSPVKRFMNVSNSCNCTVK